MGLFVPSFSGIEQVELLEFEFMTVLQLNMASLDSTHQHIVFYLLKSSFIVNEKLSLGRRYINQNATPARTTPPKTFPKNTGN